MINSGKFILEGGRVVLLFIAVKNNLAVRALSRTPGSISTQLLAARGIEVKVRRGLLQRYWWT